MAMLLSILHLDHEVSQEPAMTGQDVSDADALDTLLEGQKACLYAACTSRQVPGENGEHFVHATDAKRLCV